MFVRALFYLVVGGCRYPVDLVQVVGLEDGSAHDSGAVGSSHHDLEVAEHEVEVGFDGGCVTLLVDGELGAERGAGYIPGGDSPAIERVGSGGEVRVEAPASEAVVGRACFYSHC